ncbi:sec-independent translocase [Actinomadura atramentaria]|uniref:sec-independent translocase n=1 Tax=Actinomadura atramentaria TaxID=1990 RepID=UPI00037F5B4E|nr:sec-independent translocase [Actinomadura atramentaria]
MFDVGLGEMVVLVVLALVIFGDKLPSAAQQLGRTLRQFRSMADNAKSELQKGLGPEFKDFDIADLHPKTFVRKHLFEDDPLDFLRDADPTTDDLPYAVPATGLPGGERPPFDDEAT